MQLNEGALPLVPVPDASEESMFIALRELMSKKIDAMVRRGEACYLVKDCILPGEVFVWYDTTYGTNTCSESHVFYE